MQAATCSLRAHEGWSLRCVELLCVARKRDLWSFFWMHVTAVSDAIKKRGQLDDYKKATWKYEKAKEAIESTRAGLLLLGESVRKLRKEKKKTKEGEKVAPAKATFRVS